MLVHNECPVSEKNKASNGLYYKSNEKHSLGKSGRKAGEAFGIEPKNSLELFNNLVPSIKKQLTDIHMMNQLKHYIVSLAIVMEQNGIGAEQQIKVRFH